MTILRNAVRWIVPAFFWGLTIMLPGPSGAQQGAWIQIEARPNQPQAEQRALAYSARLPNVNGYRLSSGWYAIALGPYDPLSAEAELARFRARREIPADSFVSDGSNFRARFWPPGGSGPIAVAPEIAAQPSAPPAPIEPADETLSEARAGERDLTRDEREDLQRALRASGYYNSTIDGAFGPGTRRAMAAWQAAFGYEPTGVLTTRQRREATAAFVEARESLGLTPVQEARTGIDITLPLSAVTFQGYDAPFARYTGEDIILLLISQSGDHSTLQGLYDVMQTLEIVPMAGDRRIRRNDFTLTGTNDRLVSHTYARLSGGAVKGFTLVWPAGDELRRRIALEALEATFRPIDDIALPDDVGDNAIQRPDLLAGLQIRQPEVSASGLFVSDRGAILTALDTVDACARITVEGDTTARLAASDPEAGLALLQPDARLAPLGVARLSATPARLKSEIAVAGYSYGGILGAPTISFGTLEDVRGLNGTDRTLRLDVNAQDGDAGGPVLDESGGVLGILLPPRQTPGKTLPEWVRFAADTAAISGFLSVNAISPAERTEGAALAPEDLAVLGADMTALVECWN